MGSSGSITFNSLLSLAFYGSNITEVAVISTLCSFFKNFGKLDLEISQFIGWKEAGVIVYTFFDFGDLKSYNLSIFFLCRSFKDAFGEIIACVYFFASGVWHWAGVEIYESDFFSSHCRQKSKKEEPDFLGGLNITGE